MIVEPVPSSPSSPAVTGLAASLDVATRHAQVLSAAELGRQGVVRFAVRRLPAARLVWLNARWFLDHGVDVEEPGVAAEVRRDLLERFGVLSEESGQDHATAGPVQWLEADRYGGTEGALHGGSGRCGGLGGLNAKGVGKTPLVSEIVDELHRSGFMPMREAIREAIASEVCRAELPFGAVPIVAIIDTRIVRRFAGREEEEGCAIVVRPDFLRPAHFERSLFFGRGGPDSEQSRDAIRVRDAVRHASADPTRYPGPVEMFMRLARQLGSARARRLWQGRFLTSNLGVDGALVDFGAFRSVPSWRRCMGLAGECFGSEVDQLRRNFLSVAYYFAKYAVQPEEWDVRGVCRNLHALEEASFVETCLHGLGVAAGDEGQAGALPSLVTALYRQEQSSRTGDSRDNLPFWLYRALTGHDATGAPSVRDAELARAFLSELDGLAARGASVSRQKARVFFEPRADLNLAAADARAAAIEQRLRRCGDEGADITDDIAREIACALRGWRQAPAHLEVQGHATDVVSTVLVCRDLRTSRRVLWGEAPVAAGALRVLGVRIPEAALEVSPMLGGARRRHFQAPAPEGDAGFSLAGRRLPLEPRWRALASERSAA